MRLVVISGGYQTGKMPLARRLREEDPSLCLVHRDDIRVALGAPVTEGHITLIMVTLARQLLGWGYSVINVAWNLHGMDRFRWERVAEEHGVELEWLDVSRPEVAALIPAMETA